MRCPHCSHEFDFTIGRYVASHFGPHVCPRCGEASKLDFSLNYFIISLVPSVSLAVASTYYFTNKYNGDYRGPLLGFAAALPVILIWDYIWDRSARALEVFPAQKGFRVMVTNVPEPSAEGTTEEKTDGSKPTVPERPGIKVTKFLGYAPGAQRKTGPIVKPPVARNPTTTVLASKKTVPAVVVAKTAPVAAPKQKAADKPATGLFGQTVKGKAAGVKASNDTAVMESTPVEEVETTPSSVAEPSQQVLSPETTSHSEHSEHEDATAHVEMSEPLAEGLAATEHSEPVEEVVYSEQGVIVEHFEPGVEPVHPEHEAAVAEHYEPVAEATHFEQEAVTHYSEHANEAGFPEQQLAAEHYEPAAEVIHSEEQAVPDHLEYQGQVDPEIPSADSSTIETSYPTPEVAYQAPPPIKPVVYEQPPLAPLPYDPQALKTTVLPKRKI